MQIEVHSSVAEASEKSHNNAQLRPDQNLKHGTYRYVAGELTAHLQCFPLLCVLGGTELQAIIQFIRFQDFTHPYLMLFLQEFKNQ
jgi:hypothetical protein